MQDISEHLLLIVMGFHMSQTHVYHRAAVVPPNLHCSSRRCQAGGEGCTRERRVVHHICQLAEWNLSSWLWWHSNVLEQGLHCLPQTWGNKANIYPQRMNLFGRRLHKQHGLSSPTCEDTHSSRDGFDSWTLLKVSIQLAHTVLQKYLMQCWMVSSVQRYRENALLN